jgi:glycosyltransferase involved in cell wall biosynthesis
MKVLIYSEYFWPIVGGVQTAVDLLAHGLARLAPAAFSGNREPIEVTLVTRTAAGDVGDSAFSYRIVRQPGFFVLVRLIRRADVIHVAGPCFLPLAIATALRKPTVIEHHGYQASCPNGLLFMEPSRTACPGHFMQGRIGECLRCCSKTMSSPASGRQVALMFPRRWLCRQAKANITVSDHVGGRLRLPRSRTIYHGTADAHRSAAAARDTSLCGDAIEIACIGRLVTEKGVPVLFEAAKHLKERGTAFRLTLIGDGPERHRLEELADRLDLKERVTFTGDLRGDDLEKAVNRIAVLVMPSVCEETLGLSAIEQMMRGRVVIAADIGGLSEAVGDAGLKFPAGPLRATLGSAARARAQQLFSQDRMIDAHVSLYRQVLFNRKTSSHSSAAHPEISRETNSL